MVKNLLASSGDVGSNLGKEDPLEEETAAHSSILAWKIPRQRRLAGYSPWGRKELDRLSNWVHTHPHTHYYVSKATFNYIYTFENEIFIHKLLSKCINLLKHTHSWIVWIIFKMYSILSVVLQKCLFFFLTCTHYLFIYFWLHWAFSSFREWGLLSSHGAPTSQCRGFSRCGAWAVGTWALVVMAQGLIGCRA